MRQLYALLLCLSLVISVFNPVKAAQNEKEVNCIGIAEASQELLKELERNDIRYNDSTKISVAKVVNKQNPEETSTVLQVYTVLDEMAELSWIWNVDEEGSVAPVKLVKNEGAKSSPGYNVVVDSNSNTVFVGTTRSGFNLYVSGINQYIRPISAAFSYYYKSGYSGTFNGSYAYYANGPLYSYPSYSLIEDWYNHSIISRQNAASQHTAYTTNNDLGYGYCIGLATASYDVAVWGVFSGTAAGVPFEWYMNAIDIG